MSPDPTLKKGTFSSCRNSTAIYKKSEGIPFTVGQNTVLVLQDRSQRNPVQTREHVTMSAHPSVQGTPGACSQPSMATRIREGNTASGLTVPPPRTCEQKQKGCDLCMTQKPGRGSDRPSEVNGQREDTESYQEGQMEQSVSWSDLPISGWPFQTFNCGACKKPATSQTQ